MSADQFRDLMPGDVVDYRRDEWPEGTFVRSPLTKSDFDNTLYVLDGHFGVRNDNGTPYGFAGEATVTVISRAPRPLYVNHLRAKPVVGDVIRDCDRDIWAYRSDGWQAAVPDEEQGDDGPEFFKPLTLLVDGETGRVVQ